MTEAQKRRIAAAGLTEEEFEPKGTPTERIDDIWTALREAYEEGVNEVDE